MELDPSVRRMIGYAIREQRSALGLTQAELAERADLSNGYVSGIECGRATLSLEALFSVAEALETTPYEVLRQTKIGTDPEDVKRRIRDLVEQL